MTEDTGTTPIMQPVVIVDPHHVYRCAGCQRFYNKLNPEELAVHGQHEAELEASP